MSKYFIFLLILSTLAVSLATPIEETVKNRQFVKREVSSGESSSEESNEQETTVKIEVNRNENPVQEEISNWLDFYWNPEHTADFIQENHAKLMKLYMDETIDPCDDFYDYACKNWENLNPIPKDKSEFNIFSILANHTVLALDYVLTNSSNDDLTDEDATKKAVNFYKSCKNVDIRQNRGIAPLLEALESYGGWPVLDSNWTVENYDWINLTAKLNRLGRNIFLETTVMGDLMQSDVFAFYFDETSLLLPTKSDYTNPNDTHQMNAYKKYASTVLTMLGINQTEADSAVDEIMEFETNLAMITNPEDDFIPRYQRLTVEKIQEEVPNFDIKKFLSILYDKEIDPTFEVVMLCLNYIRNLCELVESSDPKIVTNYLLWRFVSKYVEYLDQRFADAEQNYMKSISGQEESPPHWRVCADDVNRRMGFATGALFVKRYFDETSKSDVIMLTNSLQDEFCRLLDGIDWLDETTRDLAKRKVRKMSLKMGYPDHILDREKLNAEYPIQIDPIKYFENVIELDLFSYKKELNLIFERVNRSKWEVDPVIVNAYFQQNKNEIIIPAGILQPPLYHRHFPKFLKYGGIGVFIGHELTHGFDSSGRKYDEDGSIKNWWSNESITEFQLRANCMSVQYSNLSFYGITGTGQGAHRENIADNGGLRQAFNGYKNWLELNKNSDVIQQEQISNLNMTSTQLFFLGFAQAWCGAIRPEGIDLRMKTDFHLLGKFRVIGTLTNFEEFSNEFNCPLGSKMNPHFKCRVW